MLCFWYFVWWFGIFVQTTNLVFVTFYRSRQVLRSVVHRKTTFCIDFVLIWIKFVLNFVKNAISLLLFSHRHLGDQDRLLKLRWRYLTTGVEKRCFFLIFWPPAGQHSPGRIAFTHICIHMHAYVCILYPYWGKLTRNVEKCWKVVKLYVSDLLYDGLGFFSDN